MAKSGIVGVVVVGGLFFGGYEAALSGALGPEAQKAAQQIQHTLFPGTTPTPTPGPTPVPSGTCGHGGACTYDQIRSNNPLYMQQMVEWKCLRQSAGQNANDWGAWRAHQIALGAPDPGPTTVEPFTTTSINCG